MASRKHEQMLEAMLAVGAELSAATMLYQQTVAARLGLNVTDHGCLQLLVVAGAMTAGDLAQRLGLSAGAVTGVIDRLERAGYVERVRDAADRRRVIVEPVAAAIDARVAPLGASIHAALAAKVRRYDAAELELVLAYLTDSLETLRTETERLQAGESGDDLPAAQ